MKHLIAAILVLAQVTAFANDPESATLRAKVTEVKSGKAWGMFSEKFLTLEKKTFLFEENVYQCEGPLNCDSLPAMDYFDVEAESKDRCGSTVYQALERLETDGAETARRLTVVDHATRICNDYKPYRWEVQIDGVARRQFVGNPEVIQY